MTELFENIQKPETAVLIGVDLGEYDCEASLDELEELAKTAGAEVEARVTQRRETPDSATFIGSGRLKEIKNFCADNDVDLLIFDSELTPSQQRNIEDITDVRVVDRTQLILDIFAARARSGEGKLQVELAQLKYLLPRLGGKGTSMSRLGGGIGTRGPGETKLESDRRHIRRRIKNLEDGLEALSRRRKLARERREKDEVETVAIVGYTNAGKSTLMNMLGCLDTPTSGKYVLDGQDVASMTDNQLADVRNKEIGFIFQGFNLISNLDAVENVELPLVYRGVSKNERKQLAMEALKSVGLEDRMKHKPNEMSGGQQQRVAVARAVAAKPPIILADEPTGNLDTKSTQEIMEILKELHRSGRTVIIITHDEEIASQAHRVIRILDGRIEEDYCNR